MKKHVALISYLILWFIILASVIWSMVQFEYPLWLGFVTAYLLFLFLNGSLSYWYIRKKHKNEGTKSPPYLSYILFPDGVPKLRNDAPRFMHVIVGIAALFIGAFLTFCGIALAIDSNWPNIPQPFLGATFCLILFFIGILFLYLSWRLFVFRIKSETKLNIKLLSLYLAIPFFAGLFDFAFRNNQSSYLLYGSFITITTYFIIFAWYYYDSDIRGYKRTHLLNIFIIAVSIFSIPYYLYKTRGFKKGSIKTFLFLLLLFSYMI
ncbi:MAG: hypothetical protein AAF419_02815, partial [Pseudomonadota bacterium]